VGEFNDLRESWECVCVRERERETTKRQQNYNKKMKNDAKRMCLYTHNTHTHTYIHAHTQHTRAHIYTHTHTYTYIPNSISRKTSIFVCNTNWLADPGVIIHKEGEIGLEIKSPLEQCSFRFKNMVRYVCMCVLCVLCVLCVCVYVWSCCWGYLCFTERIPCAYKLCVHVCVLIDMYVSAIVLVFSMCFCSNICCL